MTFTTWLLFLLTELVLCLTPGPAVLFVFAHGLRYGRAQSLWANLGILSGNAFYFALSATGLGMLVTTSHRAFMVVKFAGAAYLIYLGLRMIFGKGSLSTLPPARGTSTVRRGFILQAANPKALIFFTALLPQFVTPGGNIALQMLIFGVTSVVVEFFVLAAYGDLAARAGRWIGDSPFARNMNRVSGAFLVACGTGLALTEYRLR